MALYSKWANEDSESVSYSELVRQRKEKIDEIREIDANSREQMEIAKTKLAIAAGKLCEVIKEFTKAVEPYAKNCKSHSTGPKKSAG